MKIGLLIALLVVSSVTATPLIRIEQIEDAVADGITMAMDSAMHALSVARDSAAPADSGWVWADASDSLTAGFVRSDSFIGPLIGNASSASLLQGKDTTALWNAKTLQGKDTLALWKHAGTDSASYQKGDTGNFPVLYTEGYMTTRPQIGYATMIGAGKPTLVNYGVWSGFSLPAFAADEEIHWRDHVPIPWDSISDPVYCATFYLAGAEDVDDTVRFIMLYNAKTHYAGVVTNTYNTCTTRVAIKTGRSAQYSIYHVEFALDHDDGTYPIPYEAEMAGILRRAEAGGDLAISGETVVIDHMISYHCKRVLGSILP